MKELVDGVWEMPAEELVDGLLSTILTGSTTILVFLVVVLVVLKTAEHIWKRGSK
jgi:hypothetical protein